MLQPRLQPESSDTRFGSWLFPWGVGVDVRAPDGCRTALLPCSEQAACPVRGFPPLVASLGCHLDGRVLEAAQT